MTGYSPQEIHESVQNHWEEKNVREKVRESTEGNEPFFMVDGPPYLNGAPHVGHMQGKVLKDVHLRYRQMQGYDVWDQAGFDTHGLPNELATEEELGIENKNEIGDRISSAEFIRRCKERATSAQDLWKDTMWDLAIWQDFEDPYLTYEPEYIESEWWLVKQADEQDLIYQAEKPIHWCPRCQTSLSGYEVTDEYQEVEDTAVYAKFPLENREEKLVIWTTTPWTIPANMTVFVHPDYRYAVVDTGDEKLVIAEQLVGEVMESAGVEEYEVERELSGADLKGLKYEHPLMEEVPRQRELDEEDGVHRVQTSDSLVTMEEGTGLVHAATGHGQEDYQEAKPLGLPVFSPVDDDGNYTAEAGVYEGEYVHEVNERIATDLDDRNLLLLSYGFEHEYPHCWRCESKLVLRATPQWFIRNEETKQRMLEENQEVDWLPESAQTRFANFIEESPDWCISRQNYWGTPLPIWVNDETGEHRVIGSFDELEDEVGELPEDFDPHKHQADKLTWEDEDGTWRRVPDVMDVWFDSGSAPFASLHYPFEEEPFESMFPMDFITESSDQIRGWFYTTMFCGILGFDQRQYDQVLFQSHVLRADGGKMSKSSGSTIHPDDQVEKYGADLPRFYSLRVAPPWENTKYNEDEIENEIFRLFNTYYNIHQFHRTYSNTDTERPEDLESEDRWILSRLNRMLADFPDFYDAGETHRVARGLEDFIIDDLSRWYVKKVRDRVKSGDKAAQWTLSHVLSRTNRALAPLAPYITEELYRGDMVSVHAEAFPDADEDMIEEDLEERMELAREIVEQAASVRSRNEYNLRWPARRMVLSLENSASLGGLENLVREMANVRSVEHGDVAAELSARPDYSSIGPKFGSDADDVAQIIENMDHDTVQKLDRKEEVVVDGFDIQPGDVKIDSNTNEEFGSTDLSAGELHLDMAMTQDIRQEALTAELARDIQEARKQEGLEVDDKVELRLSGDTDEVNDENLADTVNTSSVTKGEVNQKKGESSLEDLQVEFGFSRNG
jgi:isoleucyl-tRNA synthetase